MTKPALPFPTVDAVLHRRLTALARRWLNQDGEGEDLVQEAYLRAIAGAMPAGEAGRQAWLATVLRHLCIDFLRRRSRYQALLAREAEELRPGEPDSWPERLVEQAQRVEAALAHLAGSLLPEDAALVLLHEVFELGHAELGTLTARSEAASRQHLHRLLRRLRATTPGQARHGDDADAAHLLALCRHAFAQRDPGALVALLRASRPGAMASSAHAHRAPDACTNDTAEPRAQLVQCQGVMALMVRLDGGFVAWLPLGEAVLAEV